MEDEKLAQTFRIARAEEPKETEATEERFFLQATPPPPDALDRRRFLLASGLGLASAAVAAGFHRSAFLQPTSQVPAPTLLSPPAFSSRLAQTEEAAFLRYNNFYEFSYEKTDVIHKAKDFRLSPYQLSVSGLVEAPRIFDLDSLRQFGLEERLYRFRCVEAWAMVVPWWGFPLRKLLAACRPLSNARYVAFQSFHDPQQAPNQRTKDYPWPYYEALRLDEAFHDLAFVALGAYRKTFAPQNGAPLRIVLPWKYGFKGPKSVVSIRLTEAKPPTFWNDLFPQEYSFFGNVEPHVPHPRWLQTSERLVGTSQRRPTLPYNGYAAFVGHLYPQTSVIPRSPA